jgi:polyisoprenoid-binding protein YceI
MKSFALALSLALTALAASPFSSLAASNKMGGKWKVDTKTSIAKWEGKKLAGSHHGELKLKSGALEVKDNKLVGGEVVIDMTTLKNYDQEGDMNARLVNHLKSDDFFSVEKNPTSTFKITKVEEKDGKTMVTGDLTIKGITKPNTFPAEVAIDGKKLTAKGDMTVDRTMYDIKFRSLKFFSNIGDKVIKDDFIVSFDITANK